MGVTEILHEIEALPVKDRRVLFEKLGQLAAPEALDSFRESMAEAARGELIDFDEVVSELYRP
jgi:hypothetical protein